MRRKHIVLETPPYHCLMPWSAQLDSNFSQRGTISSVEADELPTNNTNIDGREKSPATAETSPPTLGTTETQLIPASLPMFQLWVHLRSYALKQMVQAANANVESRATKRVEQTLQDLGVHLKPKVPQVSLCRAS